MTASRSLHPEDEIAQYRVVGPLGAGGMGEVYLAKDRTLERSVALKVLPSELVTNADRLRRFVQEAKSASSLNHPNIVTIYEIGEETVRSAAGSESGPVQFISMELVTGKTLGAKIHEEKTDLRTLLGVLAQAAEGVAKAHAAGIVHRDLKPGNIMVTDDGFAKVLDFGLAKLTEKRAEASSATVMTEAAEETSAGTVLGTVHYMSPEQVQGKSVDHRSDVFSMGCILYEAATRRRPFVADSNVETMHKILHEKPAPIEETNPDAPAELRRLIRRCLAKTPDQRLQSMKDLAIELREIVEEYESLSASATSGSGSGPAAALPPAHRHRTILALAGVAVVAAVAFGWWGLRRGGKTPAEAPFQTMRISTQTSRGDVLDAAISPDGRFLAYVAGTAGRATLRVRQVATGSDVEILPMQDAGLESPSFSPDGNYIFYLKRREDAPNYRSLMSVPSLGGPEEERAFDVDSRVTFSPDGRRIAYVRGVPHNEYDALVVRVLESGAERELARIEDPVDAAGSPAWSPDGRRIAISLFGFAPDLKAAVALFDPESGRRDVFFEKDGAFFGETAWLPDGKALVLSGQDLGLGIQDQVFTLTHPGGVLRRLTNDFNEYDGITSGGSDEAIASVRTSRLTNLFVAPSDGSPPRAITSATSPEHSPFTFTATESGVLFGSARDGRLAAWTVPLEGGEPRPFATGSGHVIRFRSESGVVAYQRIDPDLKMHVWTVDRSGGNARQLTAGSGENLLDLSPDGRTCLFARTDSTRGVWAVSTEGGEATLLSETALPGGAGFSPNGRLVITMAFAQEEAGLIRNAVKIVPVTGGEAVHTLDLPNQGANYIWGPGGRSLTFLDRADSTWNVFEIGLAGGEPRRVTALSGERINQHLWSDDGRLLALVRRGESGENLWVANADGTEPRQLTSFTGQEIQEAAWTPDGRALVVNAGTSSRDVVLIRDFR